MASSEETYIEELTRQIRDTYISTSLAVLLPIYEFVITFDQEVAAVWLRGKKLTIGSLLLVSTRWCMFLSALVAFIPTPTTTSCKIGVVITQCFQLIGYAQIALFSALRVSAIWGQNRILFFVVFGLGIAPVATNIVSAVSYAYHVEPGACFAAIGLSDRVIGILEITARTSVIVADALVLVLTWRKTYKQVMDARKVGMTTSISTCLLRDGTLYFVVLLALNLVEILTHRTANGGAIGSFIISIPPILVNRFMLNLRRVDNQDDARSVSRASRFSAPRFRPAESTLGSFAEPLDHGMPRHYEDEWGGFEEGVSTECVHGTANDTGGNNQASTSSIGCITEVHRSSASNPA